MSALYGLASADLHGNTTQYQTLLRLAADESVRAVFLGGDLLPKTGGSWTPDNKVRTIEMQRQFITGFLLDYLGTLGELAEVYAVFGNDDFASNYPLVGKPRSQHVHFLNCQTAPLDLPGLHLTVAGYPYVGLTPFLHKDWEKWDDKNDSAEHKIIQTKGYGSQDGQHYPIDFTINRGGRSTIAQDLAQLAGQSDPAKTIYVFHEAPFGTPLDQIAADNKFIKDGQLHVGSKAMRRFIEQQQPLLTIHGHIHETFHESGEYAWQTGRNTSLTPANDFTSHQLAYVRFELPNVRVHTRIEA